MKNKQTPPLSTEKEVIKTLRNHLFTGLSDSQMKSSLSICKIQMGDARRLALGMQLYEYYEEATYNIDSSKKDIIFYFYALKKYSKQFDAAKGCIKVYGLLMFYKSCCLKEANCQDPDLDLPHFSIGKTLMEKMYSGKSYQEIIKTLIPKHDQKVIEFFKFLSSELYPETYTKEESDRRAWIYSDDLQSYVRFKASDHSFETDEIMLQTIAQTIFNIEPEHEHTLDTFLKYDVSKDDLKQCATALEWLKHVNQEAPRLVTLLSDSGDDAEEFIQQCKKYDKEYKDSVKKVYLCLMKHNTYKNRDGLSDEDIGDYKEALRNFKTTMELTSECFYQLVTLAKNPNTYSAVIHRVTTLINSLAAAIKLMPFKQQERSTLEFDAIMKKTDELLDSSPLRTIAKPTKQKKQKLKAKDIDMIRNLKEHFFEKISDQDMVKILNDRKIAFEDARILALGMEHYGIYQTNINSRSPYSSNLPMIKKLCKNPDAAKLCIHLYGTLVACRVHFMKEANAGKTNFSGRIGKTIMKSMHSDYGYEDIANKLTPIYFQRTTEFLYFFSSKLYPENYTKEESSRLKICFEQKTKKENIRKNNPYTKFNVSKLPIEPDIVKTVNQHTILLEPHQTKSILLDCKFKSVNQIFEFTHTLKFIEHVNAQKSRLGVLLLGSEKEKIEEFFSQCIKYKKIYINISKELYKCALKYALKDSKSDAQDFKNVIIQNINLFNTLHVLTEIPPDEVPGIIMNLTLLMPMLEKCVDLMPHVVENFTPGKIKYLEKHQRVTEKNETTKTPPAKKKKKKGPNTTKDNALSTIKDIFEPMPFKIYPELDGKRLIVEATQNKKARYAFSNFKRNHEKIELKNCTLTMPISLVKELEHDSIKKKMILAIDDYEKPEKTLKTLLSDFRGIPAPKRSEDCVTACFTPNELTIKVMRFLSGTIAGSRIEDQNSTLTIPAEKLSNLTSEQIKEMRTEISNFRKEDREAQKKLQIQKEREEVTRLKQDEEKERLRKEEMKTQRMQEKAEKQRLYELELKQQEKQNLKEPARFGLRKISSVEKRVPKPIQKSNKSLFSDYFSNTNVIVWGKAPKKFRTPKKTLTPDNPETKEKGSAKNLHLSCANAEILFLEGLETWFKGLKDKDEHLDVYVKCRWLALLRTWNAIYESEKAYGNILSQDDKHAGKLRNCLMHYNPSSKLLKKHYYKVFVEYKFGAKISKYLKHNNARGGITLDLSKLDLYSLQPQKFDFQLINKQFSIISKTLDKLEDKVNIDTVFGILEKHNKRFVPIEAAMRVFVHRARAIEGCLVLLGKLYLVCDQDRVDKNVLDFMETCNETIRKLDAHAASNDEKKMYSPLSKDFILMMAKAARKLHRGIDEPKKPLKRNANYSAFVPYKKEEESKPKPKITHWKLSATKYVPDKKRDDKEFKPF